MTKLIVFDKIFTIIYYGDYMKTQKKSELLLIISMFVFGTIGLFIKNIPLSSGEIALYRAILAIIFIGIYLIITKSRISFSLIKKSLPYLLISGMAMGINWILLFESYKYTTISIATLSYYFAPIIVTMVSSFLFKEKLSLKQLICFIGSTIGLILITGINTSTSNNLIGILLGVGAAIFYATVILLNKFIKDVSGVHRTFLQFISSTFILIPYVLFSSGINILSLNSNGLINMLIVGFIHTGITYVLYFSSIKDLSGQKIGIFSYIDPLVAIIVSFVFLNESMSFIQIIGGLFILCFTLVNEIKNKKHKQDE